MFECVGRVFNMNMTSLFFGRDLSIKFTVARVFSDCAFGFSGTLWQIISRHYLHENLGWYFGVNFRLDSIANKKMSGSGVDGVEGNKKLKNKNRNKTGDAFPHEQSSQIL